MFYFFFFLKLFRPISDRFVACFGPFWTESDWFGACFGCFRPNQTVSGWIGKPKKKKFGHRCACSCIHGRTVPCVSDLGAPAQSAHPCFLDGRLFLGCLNLRLPKRVLLLQSLWLLHQSKSGVYSMSIFGLYKLVFHQKQMF